MNVLVTGSNGFVGGAVVGELRRRGHIAFGFDLPAGDACDPLSVWTAVSEADAVIHLAGRLGTSETFGDERGAAAANIVGALNVADACAHFDVPLVWIGTGHKGQPNPYAITKACAEDLLLGRAAVLGQRIAVVRAYHAYGPGQKACAPHGTAAVRKIIPSFVCRALTGMPLEVTGSGEQLVDLVHVREVARLLVDALGGPWGTVTEAGTGVATRVVDAAHMVIDACRSASSVVHVPMRPGEPEGTTVVATNPAAGLAWPFGLDEVVDHYRRLVHS